MYNSIIVNWFSRVVAKFSRTYDSGKTHAVLTSAADRLKAWASGSVLWNAVRSPERTTEFFANSAFYRIIQKILDVIVGLITRPYKAVAAEYSWSITRRLVDGSIAGRLVKKVCSRLSLVIGLFIILQSVIPYQYWFNSYGVAIMAFISIFYIIRCAGDDGYRLDIKKLDFALVVFIITVILAALTSIRPSSSMNWLVINLVTYMLVFVMINAIRTKEDIKYILYSVIAAISIASLYGICQYVKRVPVDPLLTDITMGNAVGRVFGTMGNANNYAEYLILTIPFFGAAYFNEKNDFRKLCILGLSALPLLNLVLTYSRGSYIAFMIVIMVYVFLKNRRIIPVLIIAGIALIPFVPVSIIQRMQTLGKDSSSKFRLDIWQGSLRLLKDYWFTGVGLGVEPFRKIFYNYAKIQLPTHAHMLPLQIWIETGIAGIASFLWLIIRMVKKGMTNIFKHTDEYLNNVVIAGISALAGILAMGMFEHVWFYSRIFVMFWISVGILLSGLNLLKVQKA